jgi:hypothetical protein
MADVTITHHAAECWLIRDGSAAAQIFVRHGRHGAKSPFGDGETWVSVAILSSYGNWAYRWIRCGPDDWRVFLAGLNQDYAMRKLMGESYAVFSPGRTLKGAKFSIVERRRSGELTRAVARTAWDVVDRLVEQEITSEGVILNAFSGCRAFRDCYWEMAYSEPNSVVAPFWNTLWRPWVTSLIRETAGA